MRPCRRARVCPERASTTFPFQVLLHSTTFPSVEGARQHSICDAQCEMYIGLAPQDNIRIGRAVDTAEAGCSTSTCFYFSLCVPPPLWDVLLLPVSTSLCVYLHHCGVVGRIRAPPLWTVNWTQGVKTAVREPPAARGGRAGGI